MNAKSPRRWFQFSLRLLLIAFTAFAIGFPIWYRWPYEEVREEKMPSGKSIVRIVRTWQRQWGGSRWLHGPETITVGDTISRRNYVRGQVHGHFEVTEKGRPVAIGQYVEGKNDGPWTFQQDKSRYTINWRAGKLDGPYTRETPNGKSSCLFSAGRVVGADGKPVRNRLLELQEAGQIDSTIATELSKSTMMDFVEMPLKDILLYVQEMHGIPITLDLRRVTNPDLPFTLAVQGLDLGSALALITGPYDLGCDYRYGMIWVTTAADAQNWTDPTGVNQIKPPPDSALALAWNEPATITAIKLPLATVLDSIALRLAIEIDTTRIAPTPGNPTAVPITARTNSHPFHDILGFALSITGCRCQLEGEKLIIVPMESP